MNERQGIPATWIEQRDVKRDSEGNIVSTRTSYVPPPYEGAAPTKIVAVPVDGGIAFVPQRPPAPERPGRAAYSPPESDAPNYRLT